MVFEELKNQIVSMKLPPGQLVLELQVSKQLEVSRTPVREAIIKLIHEGYLVEEDGKVYVNNLTIQDTKEIFQLRESLESRAAQLAAENAHQIDELIQELQEINEEIIEALKNQDFPRAYQLDTAFHEAFIQRCGNKYIIETLSKYNLLVSRIRYLTILSTSKFNRTVEEHQKIIEAFKTKDSQLVEKITFDHIKAARKTIEEYEKLTLGINLGF